MRFTLLKLLSVLIFIFGIFLLFPKDARAAAYTCKTTRSCSYCYSSCTQSCTTTRCCFDTNGDPLGCTNTYSTPSCTGGACPTPAPTGGGGCTNPCASATSCKQYANISYSTGTNVCGAGGCGNTEILTSTSCQWDGSAGAGGCTNKDTCSTQCIYSSSCINTSCGSVHYLSSQICGGCYYYGFSQQTCCSPCRKLIGYRECTDPITGNLYDAAECTLPDATCGGSCSVGGGTGCTTSAPTNLSVTKTGSNTWQLTWTPGGNGAKQFVYVGTNKVQVEGGCPYGTTPGSLCVVADENVAAAAQSYNLSNLSAGVMYYYRVVTYASGCSSPSTTLARPSSCDTDQPNLTLPLGGLVTLTTLVSSSSEIASVNYVRSGPFIDVNPTTDPTYVYSTGVTGVSLGSGTVTSNVTNTVGTIICTSLSNVAVTSPGPWWQVKDGDLTTNGGLNSLIPGTAGLYFDAIGSGGYPGVPAYGGTTNLTGSNVSVNGWLTNSSYNAAKIYNSSYYLNTIPADVSVADGTLTMVGSSIGQGDLGSGGTLAHGYYWYEYDPTQNGGAGLTIDAVDLGTRKVILIVKGADVTLRGNINLTKGSGFFLLVANNIIVDPTVGGGGGANLEGIYVADGQFLSGIATTRLWVRGTVAAYGGVSLDRDLSIDNSTTPAELFEFAPDQELLFPELIGARNINWQEVAP